jgi:hypothetical protein
MELDHGWKRLNKNTNYRASIIKLKDEDNRYPTTKLKKKSDYGL